MNLKSLFPHGSNAFFNANYKIENQIQPPFLKSTSANALGVKDKGAKESRGRITLSYRIFRTKLQDTDNSYGSTKALTDALSLCKLIPGDDPERLQLIVEQYKVSHKQEERVEVKIQYP